MIYTVIADYRRLSFEEANKGSVYNSLSDTLKEHINKPNSDEVKLSRLGGYLLLLHTVRFLYGKEEVDIGFSENGKPVFLAGKSAESLRFNISHSDGLCAVTVSDENEDIGVDLQTRIDSQRAERLKERFMNYSLKGLCPLGGVEYLFGAFSADGNCIFANIPYRSLVNGNIKEEPTDLWSLTEAILKCHGGGFCQAKEVMKDISDYKFETVRFNYKGRFYSVSTVIK